MSKHVIGKWYFSVFQSWNAQGDYDSAEIAESAGRRFCEKYSPNGLLEVGQWTAIVVADNPVRRISMRTKVEAPHAP